MGNHVARAVIRCQDTKGHAGQFTNTTLAAPVGNKMMFSVIIIVVIVTVAICVVGAITILHVHKKEVC